MADSLLGIALFNTIIGLENISKNDLQYAKQRIANRKIDRILELLEGGNGIVEKLHRYIQKIDAEIESLIDQEGVTATTDGERNLHYLFENRKHALKWAEEKGHVQAAQVSMTGESPAKTYFGGM